MLLLFGSYLGRAWLRDSARFLSSVFRQLSQYLSGGPSCGETSGDPFSGIIGITRSAVGAFSASIGCAGLRLRRPRGVLSGGKCLEATFSYDELDVGSVFLESAHRYEVQLLNQGDIEVDFRLSPRETTFGRRFQFSPTCGAIWARLEGPLSGRIPLVGCSRGG